MMTAIALQRRPWPLADAEHDQALSGVVSAAREVQAARFGAGGTDEYELVHRAALERLAEALSAYVESMG